MLPTLNYNKSFLSEGIIEAVDGFLLGDGGINANFASKVARLYCGQQYEEFAKYMMNHFIIYNPSYTDQLCSSMSSGIRYDGRTKFHPDIYNQYLRWYGQNNKNKQPPDDVRITPISVMLWYLGDGSIVQTKDSITLRLSTDGFLPERNEMLVNKLKEKGIDCSRNNDNRIRINNNSIGIFFDFIGRKSPVACYDYKFNLPEWRLESKRMSEVAKELNIHYNKLSYWVKFGYVSCLRTNEKSRPRFLPHHIEEIKRYIQYDNSLTKEEKTKITNLKKYGVKNVFQSDEIKSKIKKINLSKYGVDHLLKNKDIFEKQGKIVQEKYLGEDKQKQQKRKEIFDTLNDLGIKCTLNDHSAISPVELDIYIPDKNIAIEFNGSYWHSEAVLDSRAAKNKHLEKLKICRNKGIRLFNIFENIWDERKYQYLNLLKTTLGLNNVTIGARKCQLDESLCKEFIDSYHIQGYGRGTIKWFNLIYNGSVVASMTASNHHRQNNNNVIVLNRLCFKDGVNIIGGSKRLFSYFVKWAKQQGIKQILSWSDNCWTEGDVYKTLGFSLDKEYGPDYFYWDINSRKYKSKQSQKKSNTKCPIGKTEREWSLQRGLYRLWDCGKKKWIYNI